MEKSTKNGTSFRNILIALSTVVKKNRILDREGVHYDVSKMHIDDPRGKV